MPDWRACTFFTICINPRWPPFLLKKTLIVSYLGVILAFLFDIKTILQLLNIIDRIGSKKQIYLKAKAMSNVSIMYI